MLTYSQSQQGYFSPTHPAQFPGNDMKGKPVNGKEETIFPICQLVDGEVVVFTTRKKFETGGAVSARSYLSA